MYIIYIKMSDSFMYKKSSNPNDPTQFIVNKKRWSKLPDENRDDYNSNRIHFNMARTRSNDAAVLLEDCVLTIPIILGAYSADNLFVANSNERALSFKNGIHHLINKVGIKLNGSDIVNYIENKNLQINYKLLTEMDLNSVDLAGQLLLFQPDSRTEELDVKLGCVNNLKENTGRNKRLNYTSLETDTDFVTNATLQDAVVNRVVQNSQSNITLHVLATISLKHLSEFFEKCPMIKNGLFEIIVDVNTNVTTSLSVNVTANPDPSLNTPTVDISSVSHNSPYNTCPYMVSSFNDGDFNLKNQTISNKIIEIACTIAKPHSKLSGALVSEVLTKSYLFVSSYQLNPEYEAVYYASPQKSITFNDCHHFMASDLKNVATGGSASQEITTSYGKLRKLVIIPITSKVSNGTVCNLDGQNSPFSSQGGTCQPYGGLVSNFNVYVNNAPVFEEAITYSQTHYISNLFPQENLNGGRLNGISRGLIGFQDWTTSYGFIVVDLSRTNPDTDGIAKSVRIDLKNTTKQTVNYHCLLYYEKTMTIDVFLGQIVV